MKTIVKNPSSNQFLFISRKDFHHLAGKSDAECISIYMPIYKSGEGVINVEQNQLQLKNNIKNVASQLVNEYEIKEALVQERLRPLELLLDNNSFWQDQIDGLAIFLNREGLLYYKLPISFEAHTFIDEHFYLKPIIPCFNGDGIFYLLILSRKKIVLYKATRHTYVSIFTKEITEADDPLNLADQQKNIQARSFQAGKNAALYHGQGLGKDQHNNKIGTFFHAVDDELMNWIGKDNFPLIIAAHGYHFSMYKSISRYPYLYTEDFISGNPDDEPPKKLYKEAWNILKDRFLEEQKSKVEQFEEQSNSKLVSTEIDEIIPGAVEGRIDTLFINASTEIYGLYDKENRNVIYDQEKSKLNTSLVNLAAVKSFIQGANVYLVYPEEMPIKHTRMNAIFRY